MKAVNILDNKDTIEVLQSALAEHDLIYRNALATMEHEAPIVHSLKTAIAALKGEKINPPNLSFWKSVLARTQPVGGSVLSSNGLPIQPLPSRKPEYAAMTILNAIQDVLAHSAKDFVHADDLVKAIYEPTNDNDIFYRIKRTIVSEAIRGMKKGQFVRGPEKNTFGLGLMTNGHKKDERPTL